MISTLRGHHNLFQDARVSRDEAIKQPERMDKYDALSKKVNALEEQVRILQHELVAANEKLKMCDSSALKIRKEYEEQKRFVCELQDRLRDA